MGVPIIRTVALGSHIVGKFRILGGGSSLPNNKCLVDGQSAMGEGIPLVGLGFML